MKRQALSTRAKPVLRALLAVGMMAIGALHFIDPMPFVRIVPAALPGHLELVYLSGVFEILGGAGLLVPRTRRAAGIGLIALFLAVFPANINMAVHAIALDGVSPPPPAVLWLRLPLQIVLIAWAYWVAVRRDAPERR